MDVAVTTLAERIARTLAGLDHSANANGLETSAATSVDGKRGVKAADYAAFAVG